MNQTREEIFRPAMTAPHLQKLDNSKTLVITQTWFHHGKPFITDVCNSLVLGMDTSEVLSIDRIVIKHYTKGFQCSVLTGF